MIQRTFCHLSGVGEQTERGIWEAGIGSWDDALAVGVSLPRIGRLADRIRSSIKALGLQDWGHFRKILRGRDVWRWYADLRGRCVYVDIETTGLSPEHSETTVVACYDGREVRCFVRDRDLFEFPSYVAGYDLMVTFNGVRFDVPFLDATFAGLRLPPVHLDLLYPLRRCGLAGGLKHIERVTGLCRESGLQEVDGYMAVRLWRRHRRGDERALGTLLRYAAEDVVGLEPLAELAYNHLSAGLPLAVTSLRPTPRRVVDWPYDPSLLREMLAGG